MHGFSLCIAGGKGYRASWGLGSHRGGWKTHSPQEGSSESAQAEVRVPFSLESKCVPSENPGSAFHVQTGEHFGRQKIYTLTHTLCTSGR